VEELTCPFDLVERPYLDGMDVKKQQAIKEKKA
jgi:hypothetical protein